MKDFVQEEKRKEILAFANQFFDDKWWSEEFLKGFLIILLSKLLAEREGILSLYEICDYGTPEILNECLALSADGFFDEKSDEENQKSQKSIEERFTRIKFLTENDPSPFHRFINLFYLEASSLLWENLTAEELKEKLLKYVPEKFSDFKKNVKENIRIVCDETSENRKKIVLNFDSEFCDFNLDFLKSYGYRRVTSEYVIFGEGK